MKHSPASPQPSAQSPAGFPRPTFPRSANKPYSTFPNLPAPPAKTAPAKNTSRSKAAPQSPAQSDNSAADFQSLPPRSNIAHTPNTATIPAPVPRRKPGTAPHAAAQTDETG